jgi:hypothetical protein
MRYTVLIFNSDMVLFAKDLCRNLGEAQRTADRYNTMKGVYAEIQEAV